MRHASMLLMGIGLFGCASTGATGKLPARLLSTTGAAVPGRPVLLRSNDGAHFTETEVAVEMSRVPGPVRALRSSSCPNREGTLRFAENEIDGAVAYTLYVGEGPRACSVTARPNGVRLRVLEALDATNLPRPIAQALEGIFHRDYVVDEAFKRTSDTEGEGVDVRVRKSGQEYVLRFSPSGELRQRLRRYPGVLELPDR